MSGVLLNFRIVMAGPTRAVFEAGVDERRRFVDAAAKRRQDALDDVHEVRVVVELHVRELELAHALDEDLIRAVHHDFRDGRVFEERLDGAEAKHLVADVGEQLIALAARDGEGVLLELFLHIAVDDGRDFIDVLRRGRQRQLLLRRHLLDDALVDALLEDLVRLVGFFRVLGAVKNLDLDVFFVHASEACE